MDWNEFVQRLTDELVRLPDNAFLIVHAPGGFPYAQAMRYSNGLVGEVVANEFLPDHLRLSPVQEKSLTDLGWESPGLHGHVNWWRFVPLPADPAALHPEDVGEVEMLGGQMAGALCDVYGVASPGDLRYRANQNGPDGGPLSLPALGIPAAEPGRGQLRQPFLGWEEFTERLACELAGLDPQMVLVVHQRAEGSYYTQALRTTTGIHAEAVSSEVLPDELRVAPAIEDRMAGVGWQAPHRHPDGSARHPNWTYDLPAATTATGYRRLAAMMVAALRDVQGAREPADLAYEAFSGSSFIQLMDFGIDPADPRRINERRPQRPLPEDDEEQPEATLETRPDALTDAYAGSDGSGVPDSLPTDVRVAGPAARTPIESMTPLSAPPAGPAVAERPVIERPAVERPVRQPSLPAAGARGSVPLIEVPPADTGLAATPPPVPAEGPPDGLGGRPGLPARTRRLPAEVELEARLVDARERGDQQAYLALLLEADLCLPSPGPGEVTRFATATFTDGTYILAFTSPAAMDRSLRGQADDHRRTTFVELAKSWPRPEWQLAVNAGLPSAAYIDSGTIQRLAAGKSQAVPAPAYVPDPGELPTVTDLPAVTDLPPARGLPAVTDAPPAREPSFAEAPPAAEPPVAGLPQVTEPPAAPLAAAAPAAATRPPGGTVMQKVVAHDHVEHYLEGGYDRVAGYVHRASDVAALDTPEQLVKRLGLTYEGSPFSITDEAIHVIRWPVFKGDLCKIPIGGLDETAMKAVPDGWVIEGPPFLGTGFAAGTGDPIPEFKIDSQRLPHGAEMYRIDRAGRESFIALYDADRQTWFRTG